MAVMMKENGELKVKMEHPFEKELYQILVDMVDEKHNNSKVHTNTDDAIKAYERDINLVHVALIDNFEDNYKVTVGTSMPTDLDIHKLRKEGRIPLTMTDAEAKNKPMMKLDIVEINKEGGKN